MIEVIKSEYQAVLERKHETLTKAICNKGFSGNSSILPRIKFCVGGQESSPQSLTAYSLDRYASCLGDIGTSNRVQKMN
jgi:hypothetical protein